MRWQRLQFACGTASPAISPHPSILKYTSIGRDHLSLPHFFASDEQIAMLPYLKGINTVN